MKPKDIRQFNNEEIRSLIHQFRQELSEMKFNNRFNPLDKHHLIGQKRRDIARLLTILAEREKQAEKQAQTE